MKKKVIISVFMVFINILAVIVFIGRDMGASNDQIVQITFENRDITEESITIHVVAQCLENYKITGMQIDEQSKVNDVTELDFTATQNRDYLVKVYYQSLTEQKELSKTFTTTVNSIESRSDNVSLSANNSDIVTMGGYTFDKSTGTITKYIEQLNVTEIEIPDTIDGVEVKNIGDSAFSGCDSITSIIIPNTVLKIGAYSFEGCNSLIRLDMSDSVTYIDYGAFSCCTSLTKVDLSKGLESIFDFAFVSCTSLTEIVIPKSVKSIGYYVFDNCLSLKDVYIPNTIESVNKTAFNNSPIQRIIVMCTDLSNVNLSLNDIFNSSHAQWYRIVSTAYIEAEKDFIDYYELIGKIVDLKTVFTSYVEEKIYQGTTGEFLYMGNDINIPKCYYNELIKYQIIGTPSSTDTKIIDDNLYISEDETAKALKLNASILSTTKEIPIVLSEISSIDIKKELQNTYIDGEIYNPNGLVITVTYNNGVQEEIVYTDNTKTDFTFASHELNLSNTRQVISYKGRNFEHSITILSKYIENILKNELVSVKGKFIKDSYLIVEKKEKVDKKLTIGLEDKLILRQYEVKIIGEYQGQLLLTFDIGNEYNGKKIYIRHLKQDGSIEMYEETVLNGKVKMTVSELSPFIIYIDKDKTNISDETNILPPINNNNESSIINPIKPPLSNTNNEFIRNQESFVNKAILTGDHTIMMTYTIACGIGISGIGYYLFKRKQRE